MEVLTEDIDASVTLMMLRINKDVLSSLVRHTLAYDFFPRPANSGHPSPPKTFNPRHRGTYATSIAIKGRDGHFLTKLEIRSLVRPPEGIRGRGRLPLGHRLLAQPGHPRCPQARH